MAGKLHEAHAASVEIQVGSERSFGIVFFVVFAVIGLWPLLGGNPVRLWSMAIAVGFLVAAFVFPRVLKPLNLLWFKFGILLHHVVTPLVMGLIFFVTVTPTGILMRLFGLDPMRMKRDPKRTSYWIVRDPPGPSPESLKNQF